MDLGEFKISSGTTLLICSDGITNMVDEVELEKAIQNQEPANAVAHLVDLANQNGGIDNSTAVCLKIG